jgi:hypothetical protein
MVVPLMYHHLNWKETINRIVMKSSVLQRTLLKCFSVMDDGVKKLFTGETGELGSEMLVGASIDCDGESDISFSIMR